MRNMAAGELAKRFIVEWLAKVITFDMFSMMVDEALEQMRTMLDSNEAVQKLIANEAGEGSE